MCEIANARVKMIKIMEFQCEEWNAGITVKRKRECLRKGINDQIIISPSATPLRLPQVCSGEVGTARWSSN